MRFSLIDVESERGLAAEGRLPRGARKKLAAANGQAGWRVGSLWSRLVFFALTAFGLSLVYAFIRLLSLPAGILTGAGAIAGAELLVRDRRFLRTGIEEALYLGGCVALITTLPSSGKPEAVFVFVAAFLWCGLRLSQGLFIGIASLLLVVYAAWRAESLIAGGLMGVLLLVVAMALDRLDVRRPSFDFAISMHLLLLPVVSAFLLSDPAWGRAHPDLRLVLTIAIASIALLLYAVSRRVRPLIASATLNLALAAADLLSRSSLSGEGVALVIGTATLSAALLLERRLRGRSFGFTSDRFEVQPLVGVLETAGAAALAAHAQGAVEGRPAAEPQPQLDQASHDGSFGGAGSTGEY